MGRIMICMRARICKRPQHACARTSGYQDACEAGHCVQNDEDVHDAHPTMHVFMHAGTALRHLCARHSSPMHAHLASSASSFPPAVRSGPLRRCTSAWGGLKRGCLVILAGLCPSTIWCIIWMESKIRIRNVLRVLNNSSHTSSV